MSCPGDGETGFGKGGEGRVEGEQGREEKGGVEVGVGPRDPPPLSKAGMIRMESCGRCGLIISMQDYLTDLLSFY